MRHLPAILLLSGIAYVGGYMAIRRNAVHFPITPGSAGYSPAAYRETVILRTPLAKNERSSAEFFAFIFYPLRMIDRQLFDGEMIFQPSDRRVGDLLVPP